MARQGARVVVKEAAPLKKALSMSKRRKSLVVLSKMAPVRAQAARVRDVKSVRAEDFPKYRRAQAKLDKLEKKQIRLEERLKHRAMGVRRVKHKVNKSKRLIVSSKRKFVGAQKKRRALLDKRVTRLNEAKRKYNISMRNKLENQAKRNETIVILESLIAGGAAVALAATAVSMGALNRVNTQKYVGISIIGWLGLAFFAARWLFREGSLGRSVMTSIGLGLAGVELVRQIDSHFYDLKNMGNASAADSSPDSTMPNSNAGKNGASAGNGGAGRGMGGGSKPGQPKQLPVMTSTGSSLKGAFGDAATGIQGAWSKFFGSSGMVPSGASTDNPAAGIDASVIAKSAKFTAAGALQQVGP